MDLTITASTEDLEKLGTSAEKVRAVIERCLLARPEPGLRVRVSTYDGRGAEGRCHPPTGRLWLAFGTGTTFPFATTDVYGWRSTSATFPDLLALLLSHEVYHFWCYCYPAQFVGLDWRCEQSANAWGLAHCQRLSYGVTAVRP